MTDFITDMGRGMRRVPESERIEFDPPTAAALRARLDEFDRMRADGEAGLRARRNARAQDGAS